jgi:hypothetical protein
VVQRFHAGLENSRDVIVHEHPVFGSGEWFIKVQTGSFLKKTAVKNG